MAVEATTTCKRVVGPVVAAALMVGAVGVTAAPAQAAQTSGPADYASQAQKAAAYIDGHRADLIKDKLGPQLDGALALVAAGRKDSPTLAKVKDNIKTQGQSYCTDSNVGGCGICRNGVYLFLCQPNEWVDAQVMWGSRWESGAVPQP